MGWIALLIQVLPEVIKLIMWLVDRTKDMPKDQRRERLANLNACFAYARQTGNLEAFGKNLASWTTATGRRDNV